MITNVHNLVLNDRRLRLDLKNVLIISYMRVKLEARWLLRLLSLERKRIRVTTFVYCLTAFKSNPTEFLHRYITVGYSTAVPGCGAPKEAKVMEFLVRDCASVFVQSLIGFILSTTAFPSLWKISRACPIFKPGSPANIANYRPISLLNNFD
ncbi:hypothetical protein Trydic_g13118 [Trypoxylus dichotomus]